MDISYRELSTFDEYRECSKIQSEIFGLSELDSSSPLFLNVLARKKPKIGIVIGAFAKNGDDEEKLIGFYIGVTTIIKKTIFTMLLGVQPKYQLYGVGLKLLTEARKAALKYSLKYFMALIDPLNLNIGNLCFSLFDCYGVEYLPDAFIESDKNLTHSRITNDRLQLVSFLDSEITSSKISRTFPERKIDDILHTTPVITSPEPIERGSVLIEIPHNFLTLLKDFPEEALMWREKTRPLFIEYLNKRGYYINGLYTKREGKARKNYYLLENKSNDNLKSFINISNKLYS